MIQKTSAPGSAEPQLRNACLSFWSVKAELGLRVPGREGPVFFKIWYDTPLSLPAIPKTRESKDYKWRNKDEPFLPLDHGSLFFMLSALSLRPFAP